jgi:short subunit dehydrogenase-like uncharacterized protein
MKNRLLIYGVTGYTGALIARQVQAAGLQPIAAGRSRDAVAAFAATHRLPQRAFGLDDPQAIEAALADVAVVLNCAGPFSATNLPLAQACIRSGTHYLDLAGEVPEFLALEALHEQAAQHGVMLMPGVGFGVVPTDCLAAQLKRQVPQANRLTLAFETVGGASQGTLGTLLKDLPRPGVIRRDGALIPAYAGSQRRRIDLGSGPRSAILNPWRADLATAYRSTGIASIETYSVFPAVLRWLMSSAAARGLLQRPSVQRRLKQLIQRLPAGPSEAQLASGATRVWGEASDPAGRRATAWLHGPEAYLFTARTAIVIARRVLDGDLQPGYQTPASAYGPDLVREIPGVTCSPDWETMPAAARSMAAS